MRAIPLSIESIIIIIIIISRIYQSSIYLQPKQETVSASLTTPFPLTRNHDRSRASSIFTWTISLSVTWRSAKIPRGSKRSREQSGHNSRRARTSIPYRIHLLFQPSPYHARPVTGIYRYVPMYHDLSIKRLSSSFDNLVVLSWSSRRLAGTSGTARGR